MSGAARHPIRRVRDMSRGSILTDVFTRLSRQVEKGVM